MDEYMVEFDGINDCGTVYYTVRDWWELIGYVNGALDEMGGGHADIFDEEGNFIEDVER